MITCFCVYINFFCRTYLQSVYSHASCDPCAGIQVCAARGRAMRRKMQPAMRASARQTASRLVQGLTASEGAVCYYHSEQPLGHGQVIQVRVEQQRQPRVDKVLHHYLSVPARLWCSERCRAEQ